MLKRFIRRLLFCIIAVYVLSLINQGFTYSGGYNTLLLAGFVMFFLDTIVEPILKIVFFPINFLTRGLFTWVIAVGLFYGLTYFVPAIHISSWQFEGLTLPLLEFYTLKIPPYNFTFWPNVVLLSFLFTTIVSILTWLCEE